jgi:hypothetical protein
MNTFHEWMADNHPDTLDEGFLKNAALAGAMAAGVAGATGWMGGENAGNPNRTSASQTQEEDDFDDEEAGVMAKEAKLQAAAQRVGIPRSQWGRLKGHMTGGIVTVVNGRRVPLTPREAAEVKAVQELARGMGN